MKRLIVLISIFEAFALSFLLINIWYFAMLNGKSLSVQIDAYGEMWVEYILWLVTTPILVLGLHYTIEEFRDKE